MTIEKEIKSILVDHGTALFNAPPKKVSFAHNHDADLLINNIKKYPHTFVLGCIADRQVKAEVAWRVPYHLAEKLGTFKFKRLSSLSEEELTELMSDSGHRLWKMMSNLYYLALRRIGNEYDGDASQIWSGSPSSAEVMYRFLQFKGVGQKIGSMATNILARQFKVPMSDYYSIDISADRHVKRVFQRLHLVSDEATNEQIVYRARSLHPEFPGLLDFPCYRIGQKWCKPTEPDCGNCYMNEYCPTLRS